MQRVTLEPKRLSLAAALCGLGTVAVFGSAGPALSQKPAVVPAPGTAAPSTAPAAAKRPPLRVSTLSNGLRLLCRTNDSSELISIVCLVRAGLPDETDEQAGLAALTAEALRRGTTTHQGRAFEEAVARAGGNLVTLPGFDFTEVSLTTSREQLEPALKLIADVVAHPRFSAEDINASRELIKRRISNLDDDFTGASYQALTADLYPRSPYGRPLNGYAQTLERLTAADVQAFWKRNYVQNRMVIGVVGDVDSSRALTLAQRAFSDLPFNPDAVTDRPSTPALSRSRVQVLQKTGPAAQLMIGYLTPGATRANYPALALMDAIVGGGKRARLFSVIREKNSIGYELGSFFQPLLFQSHVVGYVITPTARTVIRGNPPMPVTEPVVEPAKALLVEQFRSLALTGPTDAELARAKSFVIGRFALRQERSRDQAKWLAWNVAMGLGADFDQYFATRAAQVTKEEVLAAAKASLGNYALIVTVPTPEREQ